MTRMLMAAAHEGAYSNPKSGEHPKYKRTAQRMREKRQWETELAEETAPGYPDWIDRFVAFQEARFTYIDNESQ